MIPSVFISGTDTGVGKTALTAALLLALEEKGMRPCPMKPVQTGCVWSNGNLAAPDVEFTTSLMRQPPGPEYAEAICPYRFQDACSPHVAADRAGELIRPEVIESSWHKLKDEFHPILVEGAGGLLVPLNTSLCMADLPKLLDLPVILAARPGLGTLNHTLLSIEALRQREIELLGIVFVETTPAPWGFIEERNQADLPELGQTRVLGRIPFFPTLGKNPAKCRQALADAGSQVLMAL